MTTPAKSTENVHQQAIAAFQRGDAATAVDLLHKAIAAAPKSPIAANDLGNVLVQLGRMEAAIQAYRRALKIAPTYPEAHNNLGNVYQMTGALDAAVASYQTALRFRPKYTEAYRNLGSALRRQGKLVEAAAALANAVALDPGFAEATAQLVRVCQQLCDWRRLDELTQRLVEAVDKGPAVDKGAVVNPFIFLTLRTTAAQQRRCAEQWARARYPVTVKRPPLAASRDRITVGYLSADFQEHATAQLISELISLHDRSRFRVLGYSYGADDGSVARQRLQASFDAFVDLEAVSHAQAAARIRADAVDILVDLKGYTTDSRPGILALRPTPIQVGYLGYPGTLGTRAIDYILADRFVLPETQQEHFAEQVVYLPNCYQVNNRLRPIAAAPAREACGLPENGFVFCCFNATDKITPEMFDIWLRLLARVPGSVLWLLESNAAAAANLRREAETRLPGGSARLVFAPTVANPEHLARFALADLFLDTLPYNAHTLSSDSLWGGCPVLTCTGETFASRVAGSILHAAGLPELVTSRLADYEALALRLAENREELGRLRARLQSTREAAPLFDTPRFARDLEAAFEAMLRERTCGDSRGQ